MEIILQFLLLILGFAMLIKGADWFVDGAAGIANKLGVPQLVIGLTIVAMGTSAPETAVSIGAAISGSADIAVGNILGSNIMNILLILGVTSIITPLAVQKNTIRIEIPFTILITILFATLGLINANPNGSLNRIDGIILLVLFVVYMIYLFSQAKKGKTEIENIPEDKTNSYPKLIIFLVVGLAIIVLGSNITIDAATAIARFFGISERFIGLTIVALGTSLPELVTCVIAGIKKNADIAIGNIVGSNIFNILLVGGLSALITNVPYQGNFFFDSIVATVSVVLLLLCVLNKKHTLGRIGGIIMLIAYGVYFSQLI